MKPFNPIPFSHSGLKSYETCPLKFYHEKVIKTFPFSDTVYTIYGKELHTAAEEYVRDGKPLPGRFDFMKPTLDALLEKPGRKFTELEMGATADLKPCGFKDPEAWCRGIADLLIVDDDSLTAWVLDYKSGSDKYPDRDQLTLMSLLTFVHFPHIRFVRSGLLFVVKGTMVKHKVSLEERPKHWQNYRERVARLLASYEADVWNPKPSGLCRKYCPVTECPHCGRT
jgi:hypothetical protein